MHLKSLRVRNFRTLEEEQALDFPNGMRLVGANNTGKTNLLKSVELLFTGYENYFGYSREKDLTFGAGRKQTSLVATFSGDQTGYDKEIYDQLDELHNILGTSRDGQEEIYLNLYFTESGNPIYRFFPNAPKPKDNNTRSQYSRIEKQLTSDILHKFSVHYIPSNKGLESLYEDVIGPFIRRSVGNILEKYKEEIVGNIDSIANDLNSELADAGVDDISASFSFPGGKVENIVSNFDFNLSDPSETSVFQKGIGIQSIALLSSFLWATKEEKEQGYSVIWLIEEPESYLHPELSRPYNAILEKLNSEALLISTTHSMNFVPQDPSLVKGVKLENNRTKLKTYDSYEEATRHIRESLGVYFTDYFNMGLYNVLVEGKSDREFIGWFLDRAYSEKGFEWPLVSDAQFLDFGGAKHLASFLQATYVFIRKERPCVSVFDGDMAGQNALGSIQQYFGNKEVPFQPGQDFVLTRNNLPIEGLFPDSWIIEIHEEHEGWFDRFIKDSQGDITSFTVKDSKKSNLQSLLIGKAEAEGLENWSDMWIKFIYQIENALEKQRKRLYG